MLTASSNRRLDNKLNIFEGIQRNWFFIGINVVTICGQVMIVSAGSTALSTIRLSGAQWVISLVLGGLSLPIGVLIRLIPDDYIRNLIAWFFRRASWRTADRDAGIGGE
jgi:P-type Ca2+ transporter type 2C